MKIKLSWSQGALVVICLTVAPASRNLNAKPSHSLPDVCLESQANHARELLGAPANPAGPVSSQQMASYVFEIVQGGLKDHWKSQARRITGAVINEANHFRLDPLFLLAVIENESQYHPETRGRHGEIGLMQIKPSTAGWLRRTAGLRIHDLRDPVDNIRAGATYLDLLRVGFKNHSRLYISAYNMGPKNVRALIRQKDRPNRYLAHVMSYYIWHRSLIGARVATSSLSATFAAR